MAKKKAKKAAAKRPAQKPRPKGRTVTTTTSSRVVKTVKANPSSVHCVNCAQNKHRRCLRGTRSLGGECQCRCGKASNPGSLIPAGISFASLALNPGGERRVDVLCTCGWGRLGIPESQVPDQCPMCGYGFTAASIEENPPRKDECTIGGCRATVAWNEVFCPQHLAEYRAWEQANNPLTTREGARAMRVARSSVRAAGRSPSTTGQAFMAGAGFGAAHMVSQFGALGQRSQASGLEAAAWGQYEQARHAWPPVASNPRDPEAWDGMAMCLKCGGMETFDSGMGVPQVGQRFYDSCGPCGEATDHEVVSVTERGPGVASWQRGSSSHRYNPPCTCGAQDGYRSPFSGRWECRRCRGGGPAAGVDERGRHYAAAEAAWNRMQRPGALSQRDEAEFVAEATAWVNVLYGHPHAAQSAINDALEAEGGDLVRALSVMLFG